MKRMTETTKAWILYAVERSVGGPHSEAVFTAEKVVELVEKALDEVDGDDAQPPPSRVMGTFYRPDGSGCIISEQTPVSVLLEVIEDLHARMDRERTAHRGTLSLLRLHS